MRYLSVCSGIEAASVAWHPLGWSAAALSEIEPFPRAVLKHRWPDVPLHGDFTTIKGDEYGPVDLLVGGTPCQSFSVAGLRKGMDDPRGNLALAFLALAERLGARWLVWENVPGVLSSNGGRDFGAFLGGLAELGYGFAYRVLDAQYFGVPQRRRRVFVVGYLGDWRRAAAVLFERHSLSGHSPPRREAGEAAPASPGAGTAFSIDRNVNGRIEQMDALQTTGAYGEVVAHCMATVSFGWQNSSQQGDSCSEEVCPTLDKSKTPAVGTALRAVGHGASHANAGGQVAVAFDLQQITCPTNRSRVEPGLPCPALNAQGRLYAATSMAVRRITPREAEALQGFEAGYTLVPYRGKPAADGPRYKAIGNSMAVPCMAYLGCRIQMVEAV